MTSKIPPHDPALDVFFEKALQESLTQTKEHKEHADWNRDNAIAHRAGLVYLKRRSAISKKAARSKKMAKLSIDFHKP